MRNFSFQIKKKKYKAASLPEYGLVPILKSFVSYA
nr:MAG: hypothetical protein [Bacteriophage sp.]